MSAWEIGPHKGTVVRSTHWIGGATGQIPLRTRLDTETGVLCTAGRLRDGKAAPDRRGTLKTTLFLLGLQMSL